MGVLLIVGTEKGAFLLRGDGARDLWRVEGPLFKGWKVSATARADDNEWLFATTSHVYGAALQRSRDLESWTQVEAGPAWPASAERKLKQIWTVLPHGDTWYAGVDEAGLFASADRGASWRPVEGLNEHPTRPGWFPGAGGLCAHAVLVDPRRPERLWVGISAVGVFRSEDGGASWSPKNGGVPRVIEDEHTDEIGYCVHALVADPQDADRIWRRDHRGMFRTEDGGDTWETIEDGLPSTFGFPLVLEPRTRALFCVPLESDEYRVPSGGRLAVYRSTDGGDHWTAQTRGLPQEPFYGGVLRHAMAVDAEDPGGVYLGTTAGTVHGSTDGGDSWFRLPGVFPRIMSVEAYAD